MEKDRKGQTTSNVVGHLVENLDEDLASTEPAFDGTEAMKILARNNRDQPDKVRFDPAKDATLEVMLGDSLTDNVPARLVYKVSYTIENKQKLSRPFAYIDAESGEIMKSWEGLSINTINRRAKTRVQSNHQVKGIGGNLKIGKAEYGGTNYKKLSVTDIGNGTCILKNNVARVYSCNQSWDCSELQKQEYSFPCDEGFDDQINGAYSPLNDALFYIGATYEMFSSWYNIDHPLRREGSDESFCSARVHFGSAFENAFWDGYYITFGDGNSTFYPLTSINVVAHEIAHGVTEMNSGLLYWGESGGMNEAFSDMAGEVVEFFATQKADWMVGYEIMKKEDRALRYFIKPSKDGRSVGQQNEYCPGMDPHYSSGLFNRAFYYLSVTKGWDLRSAYHPFVVANELYWMPASTFFEAACGVVQAAKDLELNTNDVTEAFRKVGIEPCVDTRTGASAMAEITVPANHKVIYHINVEKDMDIDVMSVKVYGSQIKARLHTPACDHCGATSGYTSSIDVCNPPPGLYMLEFSSKRDLLKGAVMITGPVITLMDNITVPNENDTVMAKFSLPDKVVAAGGQVILTMNVGKGFAIALVKHEEEPSLEDFVFDYVLWPNYGRMICQAKKGTYYILFKTWDKNGASQIDLTSTLFLDAKRVDESPPVTRPPPSEGSGGD